MSETADTEYTRHSRVYGTLYARQLQQSQVLLLCLFIALALSIWTGFQWRTHTLSSEWVVLSLVAAAGILVAKMRLKKATLHSARLYMWYERAVARLDGTESQCGLTGEAFLPSNHLFGLDLEIVGPNSLFGALATTRTAVGQEALADNLLQSLDSVGANASRRRQCAVKELAVRFNLREDVEGLGGSRFEDARGGEFETWLSTPNENLPSWIKWAAGLLTASWIVSFAASWLNANPAAVHALRIATGMLLAGQVALCGWLRERVRIELEHAQKLIDQVRVLSGGLRLIRDEKFEAILLRDIQSKAMQGNGNLNGLQWALLLLEQRTKDGIYPIMLLLGVGTQLAVWLQGWRRRHADALRESLRSWAEFDMLLALATYAREHPESIWPEIVDDETILSVEGMWHPLLPMNRAVKNDIELGEETGFLVISGSNMAGKSTLLRTLGCNVVLALAGAPVCAIRMRVAPLWIGASLVVSDSLAEGRSKFLAETERLRDIVALARSSKGCMLFLIDEILSGTNSEDRYAAADAVVSALRQEGSIGALSTHDLALTKIADDKALAGLNVHMCSAQADDPLAFDYLLKSGINRMTNGMAIVRMLRLAK